MKHPNVDQEAARELFQLYSEEVYLFARYMLGSANLANEAVVDVFVRTAVLWPTYRNYAQTREWVWHIAADVVLARLRGHSLRGGRKAQMVLRGQTGTSTEASLDGNIDSAVLEDALRIVEPSDRQVVVLRYLHDLPTEEVTVLLGWGRGKVNRIERRAMQKIYLFLDGLGALPPRTGVNIVPRDVEDQLRTLGKSAKLAGDEKAALTFQFQSALHRSGALAESAGRVRKWWTKRRMVMGLCAVVAAAALSAYLMFGRNVNRLEALQSTAYRTSFLGIHMMDDTHGWKSGNLTLSRTTDGGKTWTDVTPPGPERAGEFLTTAVSADTAFVVQGNPNEPRIYVTHDGGENWEKTSFAAPGEVLAMTFADEQHGWLSNFEGPQPGVLYQTEDGGATWTKVIPLVHDGLFLSPNMAFTDDKTGFALGVRSKQLSSSQQVQDILRNPGPVRLYKTVDAGHTWKPVQADIPEQEPDSVFALPTIIGHFGYFAIHGNLYTSHDGGTSWQKTSGDANAPQLTFVDEKHGWKWSEQGGGTLFVSNDGGKTWTFKTNMAAFRAGNFDFVSTLHGWLENGIGLYETFDGGHTWKQISPGD